MINRDKKYIKAFGERLRMLREKQGISQYDLSLKADVGKNQIGGIERGEINTTITTLNAIAKVLKIHPKDLLDF